LEYKSYSRDLAKKGEGKGGRKKRENKALDQVAHWPPATELSRPRPKAEYLPRRGRKKRDLSSKTNFVTKCRKE